MNAVLTITIGEKYNKIARLTHPSILAYADKIGADFVVIDIESEKPHWEKFTIENFLEQYDRIIFVDTDLIVRDDCPNLFDIVPEDKLGIFEEGCFSPRMGYLQKAIELYKFEIEKLEEKYYNTGVMVISKCHKKIFNYELADQVKSNGYEYFKGEQTYLNLLIQKSKMEIFELDYKFNRMTIMDELTGEERFASYIIHYAGCPTPKMTMATIMDDIEKWRNDAPEYKYKRRFLIHAGGGLGDQIYTEPVARYIIKNIYSEDQITIISHWPQLFKHLNVPTMTPEEWTGSTFPIRILKTMPGEEHPIWAVCPHTMCHSIDFMTMASIRKTIPDIDKQIKLDITTKGVKEADKYLSVDKNYVLIHPGKGWPSKTFPASWWSEIILQLSKQCNVVIIGKHLSDKQGYVDTIFPHNVIDLRDKLSIEGLIEVIRRGKILISNDSSPVHIAGAWNNWIVLIPTCKHPDHVLPYRNGSKSYKTASLYKRLTIEDIDSSPTRFKKQTLDRLAKDISEYLPLTQDVVNKTLEIYSEIENGPEVVPTTFDRYCLHAA